MFKLEAKAEIPEFPHERTVTEKTKEIRMTVHAEWNDMAKAFVEHILNQQCKVIPVYKGEYKNIREIRKTVPKIAGLGATTSRYLWICTGDKWEKFCRKSEITRKNKTTWQKTEQC